MRRVFFLILSLCLLVLCSCELFVEAPQAGAVHILVYGNDYWFTSSSKLYATVNDATQVGIALSKLCEKAGLSYDTTFIYGENRLFDSEIEAMIPSATIDPNTTKASLINHLESMVNNPEALSSDMVFIYFSGHGSNDSYAGRAVSYGTDVMSSASFYVKSDENPNSIQGISLTEIFTIIEKIPGTKVVFSDFCYSGAMVPAGYVSVSGFEYKNMSATELFNYRGQIRESSSVFLLSASRYNEESHEESSSSYNRYLHGKFTRALLEAFGWDEYSGSLYVGGAWKNNKITFSDVAIYTTKNDNDRQTPMYSGGSNDLVLFSF